MGIDNRYTTWEESNAWGTKSGISATVHSGVEVSWRIGGVEALDPVYPCQHVYPTIAQPVMGHSVRDTIPFGRKGAALAAFGDIVLVFFAPPLPPFNGICEGVKLGDSTLRRFLLLLYREHRISDKIGRKV